jgi:endonuclease/exonuclease/phosphatase (EEP) superfamily protein YafD
LHHEIVDTKRGQEHNASLIIDTTIQHHEWTIHIINIHGLRSPWDKLDTLSRDIQMEKFIEYISQYNSEDKFIIIWDFNLAPHTKLITTLSQQFTNLNIKFSITDTRGAWSPYYGKDDYQGFADYAFSSQTIDCNSFTTHEEVVSDHKALLLDFNLSS